MVDAAGLLTIPPLTGLNPKHMPKGGTAGSKRTTGGGVSGEGLAWSVSVKQTFEWPGRIPLRKAIANKQIQLAELGYDQFKRALEARARGLALTVYAAQEKAAAAREVAGRYQALREVLVQREPAGLTPVLETRIIEATEVGLQRKASEAALAEEAAVLELNQLRGQPPATKVRIGAPSLEFGPAPDTEALLAAARTNNFELRMRASSGSVLTVERVGPHCRAGRSSLFTLLAPCCKSEDRPGLMRP